MFVARSRGERRAAFYLLKLTSFAFPQEPNAQDDKPQNERLSLNDEEGTDGEDVDASAIEGTNGSAGISDERFTKEIEAGVDEDGSGSSFAEFVE